MRRPGVAITISTPRRRSLQAGAGGRGRAQQEGGGKGQAWGGEERWPWGWPCGLQLLLQVWQTARAQSNGRGLQQAALRRSLGLRALGRAAVHAGGLDAGGGSEAGALVLDLHRQLAGGRQAQHNGAVAGGQVCLRHG